MRIAYFDCFSGASGDMILASFLDAGMPLAHLEKELAKLKVSGYRLKKTKVNKNGFAAVKFDVILNGAHKRMPLKEVLRVINSSSLNKNIKDMSIKIF